MDLYLVAYICSVAMNLQIKPGEGRRNLCIFMTCHKGKSKADAHRGASPPFQYVTTKTRFVHIVKVGKPQIGSWFSGFSNHLFETVFRDKIRPRDSTLTTWGLVDSSRGDDWMAWLRMCILLFSPDFWSWHFTFAELLHASPAVHET